MSHQIVSDVLSARHFATGGLHPLYRVLDPPNIAAFGKARGVLQAHTDMAATLDCRRNQRMNIDHQPGDHPMRAWVDIFEQCQIGIETVFFWREAKRVTF